MYAIINTHHDEDWEKDTSKIATFEKLWKQNTTNFEGYYEHLVFEFMNAPAVPYLDQQYMLGDALLVAPVFREDKVAQYYLPEGTWTELLTGETKEGGRWFQGTYDYFSMPLYVRENSIVVRGNCDTKPDHDYAANATACAYQ